MAHTGTSTRENRKAMPSREDTPTAGRDNAIDNPRATLMPIRRPGEAARSPGSHHRIQFGDHKPGLIRKQITGHGKQAPGMGQTAVPEAFAHQPGPLSITARLHPGSAVLKARIFTLSGPVQ